MEEVDEDSHRAVMRANGQDKRGQGSAKATIVSTMREEGGATTVDVETDLTITGRLASFGRSPAREARRRLLALLPRAARPDQARAPAEALTQFGSSRRNPGSIACGMGDSR